MSDKETRTIKIRIIRSYSMDIEVRIDGSSEKSDDEVNREVDELLTGHTFNDCEEWCSRLGENEDEGEWEPEGLSSPWFPDAIDPGDVASEPDYIFEIDSDGELEIADIG